MKRDVRDRNRREKNVLSFVIFSPLLFSLSFCCDGYHNILTFCTSAGISFLVGWSDPLAMMVACGRSQSSSRTVLPPGVWVKMTSDWRTASSAVVHTFTYPGGSIGMRVGGARSFSIQVDNLIQRGESLLKGRRAEAH